MEEIVTQTEYYDRNGCKFSEDTGSIVAKKSCLSEKDIYFVILDKHGFLFDVTSGSFNGGVNFKEKHLNIEKYKMVRVNQPCFNSYIKFLSTGNKLHLRQAEREYRNGS